MFDVLGVWAGDDDAGHDGIGVEDWGWGLGVKAYRGVEFEASSVMLTE